MYYTVGILWYVLLVTQLPSWHFLWQLLFTSSDVEDGGETVFPSSTTNSSSSPFYNDLSECAKGGLSVKPKMGDALLFWSMKPDGSLDPTSLHGDITWSLMPCHVFQQAGVMPQYTDTSIFLQISFRWMPSDKRQQMVIDKVDACSWVQRLDTRRHRHEVLNFAQKPKWSLYSVFSLAIAKVVLGLYLVPTISPTYVEMPAVSFEDTFQIHWNFVDSLQVMHRFKFVDILAHVEGFDFP